MKKFFIVCFFGLATLGLRAAALTTDVSSAVCGGNVLSGLGGAAVNTVSANLAHQIGERYAHGDGDMSWLMHKVCHFVLGGTAAELTGGDFLAGGTGATVGEIVANAMIQRALEQTRAEVQEELRTHHAEYGDLPSLQDAEALIQLTYLDHLEAELTEQIERYSRLAAAGTALIGRMDIEISDATAELAIENNSIATQIKALKALLGANYKQITYDGVNFIIPLEAISNLAQGKDIVSSFAEIGFQLTPIGKVGKSLKFLAVASGKSVKNIEKVTKRIVRTRLNLDSYFKKLKETGEWKFYRKQGNHKAYRNERTKEIRYGDFTHNEVECFDSKGRHFVRDAVTDELIPAKCGKHKLPDWCK